MAKVDFSRIFQKADDAVKKRNFPAAAAWYGEILNMDPDNLEAAKKLRAVQVHRCKEEGKDPRGGGISGKLSLFGTRTRKLFKGKKSNPEEEVQKYEKILDKTPHNVQALLELGKICKEASFLNRARVNFETILDVEPDNVDALKNLGRVFWDHGDPQSALKIFDRAKDIAPNDGELARWIKDLAALQTTTKLEDMGDSYRDRFRDAGQAAEAEKRGAMLRTKDDIDRALQAKLKDIADNPKNARLHRELGQLHEKNQDLKKAEESYKKAREIDPRDNFAMDCLQDLQLKKFDIKTARLQEKYRETLDERYLQEIEKTKKGKLIFKVKDWSRRVKAYPTDTKLRLEFGDLLMKVNKLPEAVAQFQKCINDPKTQLRANWLIGRAYGIQQLYEPGVSALSRAMKGCPSKNAMWKEIKYDLGKLLIDAGNKDDAKKEFAELIEVDFKFKDSAKLYQELAGVPTKPEAAEAAEAAEADVEIDLDINEEDITDLDGI